ncbi:MAG: CopG family ribbon-helix-helix protein [Candidatus Nanohaloarchaea archaeon]
MAISVELPEDMEEALDEKAENDFYANRSEVIRAALRNFLKEDEEASLEDRLVANLVKRGLVIPEDELEDREKKRLEQFEE